MTARRDHVHRVHCLMLIMTAVLFLCRDTSAQELAHVGSFANVRVSNASGDSHCYGQSLDLWQHRGRMLGLLSLHEGLCGDPPCGVLENVSFQRGTGRLAFTSSVGPASSQGQTKVSFTGTLRRDDLLGTLNGQRVRLDRQRDAIAPDRSLASWCESWSRVPRCGGVQSLCAELGQP